MPDAGRRSPLGLRGSRSVSAGAAGAALASRVVPLVLPEPGAVPWQCRDAAVSGGGAAAGATKDPPSRSRPDLLRSPPFSAADPLHRRRRAPVRPAVQQPTHGRRHGRRTCVARFRLPRYRLVGAARATPGSRSALALSLDLLCCAGGPACGSREGLPRADVGLAFSPSLGCWLALPLSAAGGGLEDEEDLGHGRRICRPAYTRAHTPERKRREQGVGRQAYLDFEEGCSPASTRATASLLSICGQG